MAVRIPVCDMHAGGEPVRIVEARNLMASIPGAALLDKRRFMKDNIDWIRRFLMLEPRGHADMYGAVVFDPLCQEADVSVAFLHNGGYSVMCGHATIAVARYVVEKMWKRQGESGEVLVKIECPCGPVDAWYSGHLGRTRFRSVPCFVYATSR
jgi:proline racemase